MVHGVGRAQDGLRVQTRVQGVGRRAGFRMGAGVQARVQGAGRRMVAGFRPGDRA